VIASTQKTADRPHNLTVVIGLLSPTLAIVALLLSWRSLETSRQSIKISQRAYLSSEPQQLAIDPRVFHLVGRQPDDGNPVCRNAQSVKVSVKIWNMGNTPATLVRNSFQSLRPVERHSYFGNEPGKPEIEYDDALEGRRISARSSFVLTLKSEVFEKDLQPESLLQYGGVMRFRDEFGDEFSESWCAQFSPTSGARVTPTMRQPQDLDDCQKQVVGSSSILLPEVCSPAWDVEALVGK
jgi:hypothetical protein